MDTSLTTGKEFDLRLPSGRFHAKRFGSPDAPLALCLPGLSANLASFDFICERIAGDQLQAVALDLRGRGNSEVTAAGTYGWDNHARDAFAAVTRWAPAVSASSASRWEAGSRWRPPRRTVRAWSG